MNKAEHGPHLPRYDCPEGPGGLHCPHPSLGYSYIYDCCFCGVSYSKTVWLETPLEVTAGFVEAFTKEVKK